MSQEPIGGGSGSHQGSPGRRWGKELERPLAPTPDDGVENDSGCTGSMGNGVAVSRDLLMGSALCITYVMHAVCYEFLNVQCIIALPTCCALYAMCCVQCAFPICCTQVVIFAVL